MPHPSVLSPGMHKTLLPLAAQVYQQQSGVTAEYTAVLDTYQYGDICFTATPPAGAITRESTTRGQPAVSQPSALA